MPNPFTPEQSERIKQQLLTQPCLYNARHYLDHPLHRDHISLLTMACWLNEVVGKQVATPEIIAEILGVPGPGPLPEAGAAVAPADDWAETRAALGDVVG
jgi:hypothetical protein